MISHNNVGRSGARAVLMALRQRARQGVNLLIDLQSCELGAESEEGLFDMYSPSGRWRLKKQRKTEVLYPYFLTVFRSLAGGVLFVTEAAQDPTGTLDVCSLGAPCGAHAGPDIFPRREPTFSLMK